MPTLSGSPLVERDTIKIDDWPLELGPHLIGAKAQKTRVFIRSYCRCFAFIFQDLKSYKEKFIHIQLEDDHPIFWRPYRLNVFERIGLQARCGKFLATKLIKFSNEECLCYGYAIKE
jgi:hypothetical protein